MFWVEGVGQFVGDRYHIVRELGRGGMGVVYLARDLRRDMDVAIKSRGAMHRDATLWLKREFRAAASLRHPNLVELYELAAHEQSCYFTMEYLPGVDPRRWVLRPVVTATEMLEQATQDAAPLQDAPTELSIGPPVTKPTSSIPEVDFTRVRAVLAQIAEGLTFLHARGVIHRDVKPSNVIVNTEDGRAKLLDFGLALERWTAAVTTSRETRLLGTPAYLAPEYVEKLDVSPAMDIYALGVVAFELVTGAPPFGGTFHYVARNNVTKKVPRARSLNPDVPEDLDELIDQMMAADPQQRPRAQQLVDALTGSPSNPNLVGRAARFVGRQAELARLEARIADPAPHGRLVLVTGPTGVGKTTLIEEVLGRVGVTREPENHRMMVWRGRCHERERVPYRAFDFIIDDLAGELATDPQLAASIKHAGALGRVFPALADRLVADREPAGDLRVERERALIAMTQLFHQVVESGFVVLDDLQWADDDSLELLALLVERVARPLTIVATWMLDGVVPPSVRALLERLGDTAEMIELPLLSEPELVEVVAAVAPNAPVGHLEAAARLAAGNPYLAELIGIALDDASFPGPHLAELKRLDRLGPAERTVADLAALAVGVLTFEELKMLSGLPSATLQSVLRGLEDGRIIKVTPNPTGDPVYTFYQQRLRDAAHDAMSPVARRALHGRYADHYEREGAADRAAHHWEHAGMPVLAARWALTAADAARSQLAWSIAADWYERALSLGARCRGDKAECLFLGGKLAAAASEFETLAREASQLNAVDGDPWRVRAAESYIKLGEIDRGLAILDDVLARRGEPRARGKLASTVRVIGVAAELLAPTRRRQPADEVLVTTYRVIASFLSTPYPLESFEYVLRGIRIAERTGDSDAQSLGMAMLAAYLGAGSLGRFGDRAIAAAHRLAARTGPGPNGAYPRMVTAGAEGILATLRGDWAAMRRAHTEGEQICRKLGLERSWEASFLRTYQALGEYYAGEPTRALAILGELTEQNDDLISRALLGSHRGRALVLDGNLAAARAVERDLDRQPAARRGLCSIYRQVFSGELALAEGDWRRAEAIGNELAQAARRAWLSALPAVSAMIDTLIATAEIGRGDRASAGRARARARRLYRRGRGSFYAATALRLWGQAEGCLGDQRAAREILARASAVAAERGSNVDRLAIAWLSGRQVERGSLAFAVQWNTGGVIKE
ncbi:MAG TPA: protein kinase [Kofleriaceae bacterium]|nr:protein kinase [Kofleriaceae bacterium]